jgi:hypothetical protein
MADKGIPFDVPTRANLLQGQRLIDEQLREKSARDAKLSPLDKAYAALEAARTFGSGILATVGSLPTRAIKGEDAAQEYINQRMYIPTTEKGMDYVGNVGDFLEQLETKYKLPPVLPEAVALQNVMGPAAKQATKQAAKAAKPVVGKALEDYMFKQGLALPATVYHGSPHKFDKFDASKIGTGEGAQAYGHGLYLAESPKVAKFYSKNVQDSRGFWKSTPEDELDKSLASELTRWIQGGGDIPTKTGFKDYLKYIYEADRNPNIKNALKRVDQRFDDGTIVLNPKGQLYKVDLPDEQIAKMLDWDKPLSQQAPEVQAALSKTPLPPETTGAEAYEWLQQIGGGTKEKSQAFASRHLLEQGIPGIRYLDADSRAAGQGTSNFVVFPGEENALTILERNQQPIKKESTRIADNPDVMMMEVEDQKFSTAGAVAKQVAKRTAKTTAKAVENKPALPLDLPRAPAKTKEQIRPIAQRMAQQMTSEFVRPDPKKSVNPAGKSLKQFQMEQGLEHDIRPTAGSNLSAQQIADIEKQMGMLKIGVSGDTTIADQTLHRAGPYELDLPSPQHGGPLYGLGGEGAWASNNPVAATFQKRVQELSQAHGDAPVLGQFLAMGPSGSNFAMHFADANLRAIDTSKMSKSQINAVNDLIRAGTQKSGPRPSFSGIEDKESAYLQFAIDPELRKHFNAIMQKPDYTTKLGLPDGRVILHAITEPELRNTEILTSGLSQMRLDPSVDPSTLSLSTHPTYSHVIPKVPDSEIGKTKYLIPAEMEFPDVAEYAKKNYRPEDLTRVYQTATPRQMIDQQHIDEIRMYEEMMKELTGKKKGGAITKDKKFGIGGMASKAAKSAVATRELEKQAVLRAEAATKSAAKQALMPQYNEAVKGMTQKQEPLSFEEWKAINYPEPEMAEGGAVYNTDPDMSDGGRIIEGAPFKRGGNVSLDAMYMAVNDAKFRRK